MSGPASAPGEAAKTPVPPPPSSLGAVPIFLLWSQAGSLLQLTGQDAALAGAAAGYLRSLMPSLLLTCVSESIRRYLMAQGIVKPTMYISLVVTALSPLLNWALIFGLGWGLYGASSTLVLCNLLTTVGWPSARHPRVPDL